MERDGSDRRGRANNSAATAATLASDPSFVGGLVPFADTTEPKGVAFDVTPLINALPFGTSEISVTLVPATEDGAAPDNVGVSFSTMELRIVRQE